MECPVCQKNIPLSPKEIQEDLYYDCKYCQSSLFFQKGECQILSEGSPLEETKKEALEENGEKKEDLFSEENLQEFREVPELKESEEKPELQDLEEKTKEQEDFSESQEENQVSEETKDVKSLEASSEEIKKEPPEETFEDSSLNSSPLEKESLSSSSEELPPIENVEENPLPSKEDFAEVTNYGNKASEEGAFSYDLTLSEINSKEVREKIEKVLEDGFLNMNPEENDLSIKEGVLKLKNMSPVQVHIIVKSLIGFPLKIAWKQELVVDKK